MHHTSERTAPRNRLSALLRRRELAYLLVGGFNTLLGLACFALFNHLMGDTIGYLGALFLAYAVGIVVGFVLHRRLVFKVEGNVLVDFVRFVGVQGVGLALNAVLLPLLVEVAHLPVLPAQVLALGLVVVSTYFGHALISFRRPSA